MNIHLGVHFCLFSPSQRVVENDLLPAGLEVVDEHQALLLVAADSVTRSESLHRETWRWISHKLLHFCHSHPAARLLVYRHAVTFSSLTSCRRLCGLVLLLLLYRVGKQQNGVMWSSWWTSEPLVTPTDRQVWRDKLIWFPLPLSQNKSL